MTGFIVPLFKMILITPPMASDPYIALCDPLNTSILSTPVTFNLSKSTDPLPVEESTIFMPLISTKV